METVKWHGGRLLFHFMCWVLVDSVEMPQQYDQQCHTLHVIFAIGIILVALFFSLQLVKRLGSMWLNVLFNKLCGIIFTVVPCSLWIG
jgi:uncharacterized membrane protein